MNKIPKTKPRIVVVEDDPVISNLAAWRLSQMGYDVCGTATNGTAALSMIRKEKPDLVLLDINIEGEMDGIDVANILDAETDIPFIFLTAQGGAEILNRVKGTLQYGYIRKPFKDDDLNINIELALAKSRFINRILSDNALYESVLNHFPLGVLIADTNGLILFANGNIRSILQWQEPLGHTHIWEVLRIVDERDKKPLEDLWTRVKKEEGTVWFPHSAVLVTPQDGHIPIAGNAAPFYNDSGILMGMVITLFALKADRKCFRPKI